MIKQKSYKVKQTILPFILEATEDTITARAGLVLFGEFLEGLRLREIADKYLPLPGSGRGYKPKEFILPLVLMLNGGGRTIEDIREIRIDKGLRELLDIEEIPSSDAFYNWLRRMGERGGLKGLEELNKFYLHKELKKEKKIKNYTLDIDATAISAQKKEAEMSYKGFKGYMPMVGHLAENGLVVYAEFRQGNIAPSSRNLEFIKQCERQMPKGKRIKYIRADAASYQAEVFNYCEERGMRYAIGAHIDKAVKGAILSIKEDEWKPYGDRYIAETVHCMEKTKKAFRLIVVRSACQAKIFDEEEVDLKKKYKVVATNLDWAADEVIEWYNARGEYSENRIKELKGGFSMERMPSSFFKANAIFFLIGCLAYNLFRIFQLNILPTEYRKHQIKTIRWKLYNIAGKVVYHSKKFFLKVKNYIYSTFKEIRFKIYMFCYDSS